MSNVHANILNTVGIRRWFGSTRLFQSPAVVLGKLEYFNPLSSVKDRIGWSMIEDAEKKGVDQGANDADRGADEREHGDCAGVRVPRCRGYKLTLTMPELMSQERRKLLAALGAELVLDAGGQGDDGGDRQGPGNRGRG